MQKINVVAYCRYSSDAQRDGYSIEAQRKAIMEFCKRMNYNILEFYIDEAKTGTNDNRDAFQRMIHDSSKGLFKAVIVHKLDRFSRDRYNSVIYRKKLKDSGVKLISVLENIDDDNPEDLILLSVLEGMADYYSKNLSREVRKGMNEAARNGLSTGGTTPFGYTINKETKKYSIDDAKAILVRKFYELYADGHELVELERYALENGWRTTNGRLWTKSNIRKVLTNETYTGVKTYNQYKYKKHIDNNTEAIRVENSHDPIVSKDLFDIVQKRFDSNKNNKKGPRAGGKNHEYLFTGLMFCGCCGKNYTGYSTIKHGKNKYHYYLCRGKKNTLEAKCDAPQFKQNELEDIIINIVSQAFNDDVIKYYANEIIKVLDKKKSSDEKLDAHALDAEIKKIKLQKEKLLDLYLDGGLEKNIYLEKNKNLENKIITLETELLRVENTHTFTVEELELAIRLMIDDLKDNIYANNRKAIVKTFIKKILINKDSFEIYLNMPCVAYNDTNGGARGIRTLAPVTRSTSLAGKPLEPLEYYSNYQALFHYTL